MSWVALGCREAILVGLLADLRPVEEDRRKCSGAAGSSNVDH